MTLATTREQLHKHIDRLPDDVVEQIADFTLFVIARRQISLDYIDWEHNEWQKFSLEQFFHEDGEVEYSLDDAQEVYHP
jgi:hypothetical protein